MLIYLKSRYWIVTLWACYTVDIVKFGRTFISLVEVNIHLVLLGWLVWILVVLILRISSLFRLHLILNGIDFVILISILRYGSWVLLNVSLLFLVLISTVWLLQLVIHHISVFRRWVWHFAVQVIVDNGVHFVHRWRWRAPVLVLLPIDFNIQVVDSID